MSKIIFVRIPITIIGGFFLNLQLKFWHILILFIRNPTIIWIRVSKKKTRKKMSMSYEKIMRSSFSDIDTLLHSICWHLFAFFFSSFLLHRLQFPNLISCSERKMSTIHFSYICTVLAQNALTSILLMRMFDSRENYL